MFSRPQCRVPWQQSLNSNFGSHPPTLCAHLTLKCCDTAEHALSFLQAFIYTERKPRRITPWEDIHICLTKSGKISLNISSYRSLNVISWVNFLVKQVFILFWAIVYIYIYLEPHFHSVPHIFVLSWLSKNMTWLVWETIALIASRDHIWPLRLGQRQLVTKDPNFPLHNIFPLLTSITTASDWSYVICLMASIQELGKDLEVILASFLSLTPYT